MNGHWSKIAGARAQFIPDSSRRNTNIASSSGERGGFRNLAQPDLYARKFILYPRKCESNEPLLDNRFDNPSRKRPTSETSPQVPLKRQCLTTRLQSGATGPSTIFSTKSVALSDLLDYRSRKETSSRHENRTSNNSTSKLPRSLSITRIQYLDNIFETIKLDKADKQQSKSLVDRTLKSIIATFDRYHRGIYRRQYIDAGSYPVNMKINKADEFDVNIPLNIDVKRIRTSGKVNYAYQDQSTHLYVDKRLYFDPDGTAIPLGYAVVEVGIEHVKYNTIFMPERQKLHRKFLDTCLPLPRQNVFHRWSHRRLSYSYLIESEINSNKSSTLNGCIELIPEDVKKDLFEKIKLATCCRRYRVHISRDSHGPALKMTLVPFQGSAVKHDISVDITASLSCDIPLSSFGWPRENTKRAFRSELINEVIKAGIHLVPKKDLFWAVSFSKAEKILLLKLDEDDGCRKYVTKIIKKFVMTCNSQSANGLPGISSHIIKTRILWSCEEHGNVSTYWRYGNRDQCLINTLTELETDLKNRSLPEYFDPRINVLHGKDVHVLDRLSSFIRDKRELLYTLD